MKKTLLLSYVALLLLLFICAANAQNNAVVF